MFLITLRFVSNAQSNMETLFELGFRLKSDVARFVKSREKFVEAGTMADFRTCRESSAEHCSKRNSTADHDRLGIQESENQVDRT